MKRGWKSVVAQCGLNAYSSAIVATAIVVLSMSARTAILAGQSTAGARSQEHAEFPAGEGRDTVLRVCSKCHSPNVILANGQDQVGWENTIANMIDHGAEGSDEEFGDIAGYLTVHFPPSPIRKIFVNMATAEQIAAMLEISLDDAKVILAYRNQIKGFRCLEDMKKVPNVDAAKIDAKKDRLVF